MRRLIIRPGAIGDLIVSLPALESLKTDYTEVWTTEPNLPLVRFAGRVRTIASTGLDLIELGMARPSLREELAAFDDIVSWYGANRAAFIQAVDGLPFRFFEALPTGREHAVDFYLNQVGAQPGAVPRIDVPRWLGGFVALHPFSGSQAKNWPLDRFDEIARLWNAEWCESPQGRRFNNLLDLACWLAGARLYIGNDSGISHLAASVGTPSLVLFGPTDPRVWAPRGARVRVLQADSLESITVGVVHQAALTLSREPC